jgi:Na+-translocating ferredoxin:NAD+ oxidoreductase RnfC subunit
MLSNTFQIVSDNAKNVAAMQQAETILAVESAMSAEQLNELHSQVGFDELNHQCKLIAHFCYTSLMKQVAKKATLLTFTTTQMNPTVMACPHCGRCPLSPAGCSDLTVFNRADILEEVAQQGEAMARMESNAERLERRFHDLLRDREHLDRQQSSVAPNNHRAANDGQGAKLDGNVLEEEVLGWNGIGAGL